MKTIILALSLAAAAELTHAADPLLQPAVEACMKARGIDRECRQEISARTAIGTAYRAMAALKVALEKLPTPELEALLECISETSDSAACRFAVLVKDSPVRFEYEPYVAATEQQPVRR